MSFQEAVNYASIWSIVLPFTIGGAFYKLLSDDSRIIYFLVIGDFITQMARVALGRTPSLIYFYNIDIIVQYGVLYLFFVSKFTLVRSKKYFNVGNLFGVSVAIYFLIFKGISAKFNNEWVCINFLIFVFWILLLLLDYYENDEVYLKVKSNIFFFMIGLFFYTSCTLLIFSMWDYIMNNKASFLNNLWIIHDVFNVMMYFSFSIGFLFDTKILSKDS